VLDSIQIGIGEVLELLSGACQSEDPCLIR